MDMKTYKTKDLWEAAALLTSNCKLSSVLRSEKICYFCFENGILSKKLADKYYFGNLNVDAYKYQEAVAKLKREIFKY
jgi:hypothetical protein